MKFRATLMRQAHKAADFEETEFPSKKFYLHKRARGSRLTPHRETVNISVPAVENTAFICLLAQ